MNRDALTAAIAAIDRGEPAVLVEILEALGSTPRTAGTLMLVTESGIAGTIGGGELEWRAMERAREALMGEVVPPRIDLPLGPALGQCCGGHVVLSLWSLATPDRDALAGRLAEEDERLPRLILFGAGHVGQAVVRAVAPLPLRVRWIDSRVELLPETAGAGLAVELVSDPATLATDPADLVLVMTHSHALDLAIVEARLRRLDFAWLGLIGSATKRRRFEGRLRAAGLPPERLERLVCPIGLGAIKGKAPAVIAASVTAQLLAVSEALARSGKLRSVA